MIQCFRWLLVGTVLGILLPGAAEARKHSDLTQREKAAINVEVKSQFHSMFVGHVFAQGQVIDEASNLLNDVSVRVRVDRGKSMWTTNVSGTFSFGLLDCDEVTIVFTKAGYYETYLWYQIGPDIETTNSFGVKVVNATNLVVVMDDKSTASHLMPFEGRLKFGTVTNFRGRLVTESEILAYDIQDIAGLTNIPQNIFYLTAATNGPVIAVTNMGQFICARDATLHLTGSTNGIVEWPDSAHNGPNGPVFQRMKEAPTSGYSNGLVLTTTPRPEDMFFYFRAGGLYGKGVIGKGPGNVSTNEDEISAFFQIHVQTNGTRNLRSLDRID